MRVNARIDEAAAQQLEYLAQATGQNVSHVVRESVARYYAEVRGQQALPSRLLALVGHGRSGRADIAGNLKPQVAHALDAALKAKLGR